MVFALGNSHFSFVEYIDIINRWSHSFDNFVCKLLNACELINILLPTTQGMQNIKFTKKIVKKTALSVYDVMFTWCTKCGVRNYSDSMPEVLSNIETMFYDHHKAKSLLTCA